MKIQILLSTFNGRKHLKELLQSVFSQKLTENMQLEVLARDDGSDDGTLALLDDYAKSESRLKVLAGRNMGVIQSFFDLLAKSDPTAEYFFFCDQDDIWLPTKIIRAIETLEKLRTTPALYFSRLQYVNNELRPIGQSFIPNIISFESALVENVATGCSIAFNAKLHKIALSTSTLPPKACLMHDWWMYLLALACGDVFYDSTPSVWYRQHSGNVVGATDNFIKIYQKKWKGFWQRGAHASHVSQQAQCFLETYEKSLPPNRKQTIRKLLDSKNTFARRLLYALTLPTRRQSWLDNVIFRILIVWGKY